MRARIGLASALVLAACSGQLSFVPSASPSQSPVVSGPAASATTAAPTLSPAPTVTAATTATSTPATSVTPTMPASRWSQPAEIAEGAFVDGAVTFDQNGAMHVALVGEMNGDDGTWYGTNSSGSWVWTLLPETPTPDGIVLAGMAPEPVELADTYNEPTGELAIAADGNGTAWITYSYFGNCAGCTPSPSQGVWYSTNSEGDWSRPERMAGAMFGQSSLAVLDGRMHAVFVDKAGIPSLHPGEVNYCSGQADDWTTTRIDARGESPYLSLDPQGRPRIVYFDDTAHLATVADQSGPFDVVDLGGPSTGRWGQLAAIGPAGDVWIAANNVSSVFSGGKWDRPLAFDDGNFVALAVGTDGAGHALVTGSNGLLYFRVAGDVVTSGFVFDPSIDPAMDISPILAIDPGQRPHIVFAGGVAGQRGLYELVGPASQ